MRRALAHQVRSPERAFRAGLHACGFFRHALVRITAIFGAGSEAIAEPAQRQARGLRYAHHVPAIRNGVAECVQPSLGIERGTIGGGKNHAGSTNRRADYAGSGDADAHRACRLVSCTGNDGSANFQPGGFCAGFGNAAANFLRLEKFGQHLRIDAGFAEDFGGPFALGDVEHERAGSVGNVDGGFAGEAQAHVVFREHHFAHAVPMFGLVLLHPQEFGEREIGERRIAGKLDNFVEAEELLEMPGLRFGALVAPDERGANDFIALVEQNRAVHLPGKADARDGIGGFAGGLNGFADGDGCGAPPVPRILLGPAG